VVTNQDDNQYYLCSNPVAKVLGGNSSPSNSGQGQHMQMGNQRVSNFNVAKQQLANDVAMANHHMSSSTVRRGTAAPVAKSAANEEGKLD
jgi:hypothetical protein